MEAGSLWPRMKQEYLVFLWQCDQQARRVEYVRKSHLRPSGVGSHTLGLALVSYSIFLRRRDPSTARISAAFGVKAFMIQKDNRKTVNREPIANDSSIRLFTMHHLFPDHSSCGPTP